MYNTNRQRNYRINAYAHMSARQNGHTETQGAHEDT